MSEYNGWTNRETWTMSLWIDFESPQDVENAKAYLEEEVGKVPQLLRDFLCVDQINWDELREHAKGGEH